MYSRIFAYLLGTVLGEFMLMAWWWRCNSITTF